MKTFITSAISIAACITTMHAQSGVSFDIDEVIPKSTSVPDTNVEQADLTARPSRFVGDNQDAYIESLSSTFAISNRKIDPFGRHQDPNYKPPKPEVIKPDPKTGVPVRKTPFSDYIAKLQIIGVMQAQQKFMINGGRAFTLNQVIPLKISDSKVMRVRVESIAANRVTFRNLETDEVAHKDFGLRPDGLEPDTGISRPGDGITPTGSDIPIDISKDSTNLSSPR